VRAPAREAATLTLRGLSKRFDEHLAVDDMNLHVEPGELIVLLGPSGCGKTTTLRMIAGFVNASSGDILLDGDSILDLPAYRRDMGVVFQSYALFPHMTVVRNVRFGLEVRRMPEPAAAGRVAEMLRLVKLERLGVLDENGGASAPPGADHDRHRGRQTERARASDDQYRNGIDEREGHSGSGAQERPCGEGQQGGNNDARHKPAGNGIGQGLDGRARWC
jgi:ABC-type glutathione transport system ATPase component